MRVVGQTILDEYGRSHTDVIAPLGIWVRVAKQAGWRNVVEVRRVYPHADYVKPYTVFNIKGNAYRLVTVLDYTRQVVAVKRCMTHAEYDKGDWK